LRKQVEQAPGHVPEGAAWMRFWQDFASAPQTVRPDEVLPNIEKGSLATMNESRKRESRTRVDNAVITLPDDLKSRLSDQKTQHRYSSERDCMFRAIDLGLSVMEATQNISAQIVNNPTLLLNIATQEGGR